MFEGRRLTILFIPEEGGKTYEFKMRRIVTWVLGLGLVAVLAMLVIGFHSYSEASYLRKRVTILENQLEILREHGHFLDQLETDLDRLTGQNVKLRRILSGHEADAELESVSGRRAAGEPYVPGIRRLQLGRIRTVPTMWPIRGALVDAFADDFPAAMIAAETNSLVRASGQGWVERAGFDETLGNLVVIDHNSGVKSLYGYAAMILVNEGDHVEKGQPIALSGTSRATGMAGLYFAIHENKKPHNPVDYLLWL